MSTAEASPGKPKKHLRFGFSTILYGLGISSAQVLHGTSDTIAARIIDDEALANISMSRAVVGLGAFALCAVYYKRHHMAERRQIHNEIIQGLKDPQVMSSAGDSQLTEGAEVITLPQPVEVENPTEEAA